MTLKEKALAYHREPKPGKTAVALTKPTSTPEDLSLAYTPGVAEPCREIARDARQAYAYTAKGNLVAVISNGTAVLGLGAIGALAGKPVMEGKAVLFKCFADVDAVDVEVDERDPDKLVEIVCAIAPTYGGINLEDIKAPECFAVEAAVKARLDIPVFHDDQHGTAVVTSAALLNALTLAEKPPTTAQVVICGAGAAGLATANMLLELGFRRERLMLVDTDGVIHTRRRRNLNPYKREFARSTNARVLEDAVAGADAFIGLSAPGVLRPEALRRMARNPVVLAMANPVPEIGYDLARATRPDAIVATGRSDYPNQVNNVLVFPALFRGALDVRAREINAAMKRAAVDALVRLAQEPVPEAVRRLYKDDKLAFGRFYILPKPFDRRVLSWVAPAVARAAMESGAARLNLDLRAYRTRLEAMGSGSSAA